MSNYWENAVVSEIIAAEYVPAGEEEKIHYGSCPCHTFIMNDEEAVRDYCFADGTIVRAWENSIFSLPKDVKYYVRNVHDGGSYRIAFELVETVWEKPFSLKLRNYHDVIKIFREAANVWKQTDCYKTQCMKSVYDIILAIEKELNRNYIPNSRERMIAPAMEEMHARFTDNELSIAELAKRCGISDVYFRRLFHDSTGVNPREYIIRLRIQYAERLLKNGELSVAEVAASCGYVEVSSFSREFTKRMGISPSDYKKNSFL